MTDAELQTEWSYRYNERLGILDPEGISEKENGDAWADAKKMAATEADEAIEQILRREQS